MLKALKYNGGKDRWDLLPNDAIREVIRVLGYGANKYTVRKVLSGREAADLIATILGGRIVDYGSRPDGISMTHREDVGSTFNHDRAGGPDPASALKNLIELYSRKRNGQPLPKDVTIEPADPNEGEVVVTVSGERNWEAGFDWSVPYAATMRHMTAWFDGEDLDPESGRSHLAHAACEILFLLAFSLRGKGRDNRPVLGARP